MELINKTVHEIIQTDIYGICDFCYDTNSQVLLLLSTAEFVIIVRSAIGTTRFYFHEFCRIRIIHIIHIYYSNRFYLP